MRRFLIVTVFVAGAVLAGCSSSGAKATTELQAKDITFSPTAIQLKAGEKVEFVVRNGDTVEHNLTVAQLGVNKDVEGGETGKATATPNAGTYEFHCKYHPDQMKGSITVA